MRPFVYEVSGDQSGLYLSFEQTLDRMSERKGDFRSQEDPDRSIVPALLVPVNLYIGTAGFPVRR